MLNLSMDPRLLNRLAIVECYLHADPGLLDRCFTS